jgi:hypothetical protein
MTTSRLGSIGISSETLGQRLADAKVTVIEREGTRRRYRVKRMVHGGARPRVWHIRTTEWLYPPESGAGGAGEQKTQAECGLGDALH